jgi:hypothetical protein
MAWPVNFLGRRALSNAERLSQETIFVTATRHCNDWAQVALTELLGQRRPQRPSLAIHVIECSLDHDLRRDREDALTIVLDNKLAPVPGSSHSVHLRVMLCAGDQRPKDGVAVATSR